jgi:hypothetical protein
MHHPADYFGLLERQRRLNQQHEGIHALGMSFRTICCLSMFLIAAQIIAGSAYALQPLLLAIVTLLIEYVVHSTCLFLADCGLQPLLLEGSPHHRLSSLGHAARSLLIALVGGCGWRQLDPRFHHAPASSGSDQHVRSQARPASRRRRRQRTHA